jgi:hypothetical protein
LQLSPHRQSLEALLMSEVERADDEPAPRTEARAS